MPLLGKKKTGRVGLIEELENRVLLSWTTIADFPGYAGPSEAMAADRNGNLFAAGGGTIWERAHGNTQWTTLLTGGPIGELNSVSIQGMAVDGDGNLYAAGSGIAGGASHFTVLERSVGTGTFSVIDDFPDAEAAVDVTADAHGNAYAVGSSLSGGQLHGITRERIAGDPAFKTVDDVGGPPIESVISIDGGVSAGVYVTSARLRKSTDGGTSWTTVDTLPPITDGRPGSAGGLLATDGAGNLYAIGATASNGDLSVFRTGDGGGSWTTLDAGPAFIDTAATTDLSGSLYVAGGDQGHGVVRTNANGTWAVSDNFSLTNDTPGEYLRIISDPDGNLFACGEFNDAGGNSHLIVRMLPAAAAQPPRVTAARFNYDTLPNSLSLTFSKDVFASLSSASVEIQNTTSGASLVPRFVAYDTATNTATFTSLTANIFPDGNYQAVLLTSITDSSGTPLDGSGTGAGGNYTFRFFSLAGDVNHDGSVGFDDLVALARHYGEANAAFSDGDLNYDGKVNFDDLVILARTYGDELITTAGVAASKAQHTRQLRR